MINLDGNRLTLSGAIGLSNLMEYKQGVERTAPAEEKLIVDLGELEVHGSAALALLVFLRRRSASAGGEVRFVEATHRLVEMAKLAGLVDVLSIEGGSIENLKAAD